MTAQDGFTEKEFYHAWDLVTYGIKYTEKEVAQLDPERQRIARLVNELYIWRAEHRVSDEAQASYEELRSRIRQKRQTFRDFDRMVRECMLLHPERVPEEIREIVFLKPRGWQAIIAESKRQGKNASGRQGTKSPLSLAVERLNAPDFDSLLNMLEDADLIDDLFEHPSDPIHIHGLEVDRETQRVTYSVRYRPKPKTVRFKRLKEIFNSGNQP